MMMILLLSHCKKYFVVQQPFSSSSLSSSSLLLLPLVRFSSFSTSSCLQCKTCFHSSNHLNYTKRKRLPTTTTTTTTMTPLHFHTIAKKQCQYEKTKFLPHKAIVLALPKDCISSSKFSFATTATTTKTYAGKISDGHNNIQGTIPNGGHGIDVMQYAQICREFTLEDVALYGNLIGDHNPIHQPSSSSVLATTTTTTTTMSKKENYTSGASEDDNDSSSSSSKVIVHGMLVSSLFSSIFGTLIPGSVYRSQSLKFHKPVYVNDDVIGRVDVLRLRRVRGGTNDQNDNDGNEGGGGGGGVLCTCSTKILKQEKVDGKETNETIECVTGEATVWLPGITTAQ